MQIDFRADFFVKESTPTQGRSAFQEIAIRITIAGVDLLGFVKERDDEPADFRWGGLSILGVAKWGLYSIRRAREISQYAYELGRYGEQGALLFQTAGEDMLIHSTVAEKTVRISYLKLIEAWEEFADRVRVSVLQEFPEMKEVPGWREWLIAKRDVPWGTPGIDAEMFPSWRMWFDWNPHAFDYVDAVET